MPINWRHSYDRARALCQNGHIEEAISEFKAILESNPSTFAVHNDLGIALFQRGSFAEAVACFETATRLNGNVPRTWYNGGTALCAMHRLEEGIGWFCKALALDPEFADAHYNISKALKTLGRVEEARIHLQAALKIDPANPDALNNLGTIMLQQDRHASAETCFARALALNPSFHEAAYNSAVAKQQSGCLEDAIKMVARALEIRPNYGDALALHVLLLQQACDWHHLRLVTERLEALTRTQLKAGQGSSEAPFLSFTRSPDPQRNLDIARLWSRRLKTMVNGFGDTSVEKYRHNRRPELDGKITVAYLSEQFRNAATAHLMASMFGRHDRKRFKIIAYSWGENDGSAYRRKIERDVDLFVDIRSLSDEAAARQIYDHGVDILVDLMGWMNGHRMGIAARRPAPVQANYLGYPGTTGADFMDYIIADDIVIPPEQRSYYSEKVVSMPHSYQVTDPNPPCIDEVVKRSDHGLPDNGLVFCSFNTDYKIEEPLFDCWMGLLNEVRGSVLWLIARSRITKDNLRNAAHNRGIDPQRLIFASPLPKDRHLARLKLADLALDTLTVNGHTTTSDALWAGVPVITVCGRHFASRVAASLLKAIGLSELITPDLISYYKLALSLASDTKLRESIRTRLLSAIPVQPLFDVDRFVRNLESAYTIMWQNYLQGQAPMSFKVKEPSQS